MSDEIGDWDNLNSVFSSSEERRVLYAALDSFRQYRTSAYYDVVHRRRQNFYALPEAQWRLLAKPPYDHLKHLDHIEDAINSNADIADAILNSALQSFGLKDSPEDGRPDWQGAATTADIRKARSTIRQIFRDWSAQGEAERAAGNGPVRAALNAAFDGIEDRSTINILIPGAGLGRMVFELCADGYTVEGNEISYHQLITSNYILNHVAKVQQYDLYPFALEFSNNFTRQDQLQIVRVPDRHAGSELSSPPEKSSIGGSERMSMTAADFLLLYCEPSYQGMYDAVATVFFIDTAPNVIRYIETINNCLKVNGLWINNGPLLWHFGDNGPPGSPSANEEGQHLEKKGIGEPGSVELTNEDLLHLVTSMGFEIMKKEVLTEARGYIQNPASMLQNQYRTSFWIAKKVALCPSPSPASDAH